MIAKLINKNKFNSTKDEYKILTFFPNFCFEGREPCWEEGNIDVGLDLPIDVNHEITERSGTKKHFIGILLDIYIEWC